MRDFVVASVVGVVLASGNALANDGEFPQMIQDGGGTSESANEDGEKKKEVRAGARPECPFGSYIDSLSSYGKVIWGGVTLNVEKGYKINNAPLKKGDVIAYMPLSESVKYYTPQKDVVFVDPSPLNPNGRYPKGSKAYVLGVFIDKHGQIFDLVGAASYSFAVIDEKGFFCSGTFNKKTLEKGGMSTAYQEYPMQINYEPSEKAAKHSVSLSVVDIVGARLDIEVAYFINNKVSSSKIVSVNAMESGVDINGLVLEFGGDMNAVSVKNISMPSDFSPFVKSTFRR